jgi:hypothetical protein
MQQTLEGMSAIAIGAGLKGHIIFPFHYYHCHRHWQVETSGSTSVSGAYYCDDGVS